VVVPAVAYGRGVASSGGAKVLAIAVYTVLRVALFFAVWLTIELITPISGLWAIVTAILISGAISLVVLDRQRGRVGAIAAGFFGGINERIEASARAEDYDDDPAPAASGEGEQGAQRGPVDQQ
jgi:hypothetical protein